MSNHGVVLFTRDLRVHDQPALAAALERCERVLPVFVLDERVLGSFGAPNRVAFLLDALRDLRSSLRDRGGELVIRRGDVVEETLRVARDVGAEAVFLSEDVSSYAQERERRLGSALSGERIALETSPGVTVVPPGEVAPAGGEAFKVFTPYWRRWRLEPRRPVLEPPARITLPEGVEPGEIPDLRELVAGRPAAGLPTGGETAGRQRLSRWLDSGLARYEKHHDDLAADSTSRLSPYLHFGCLSPAEVVERAFGKAGGEGFVRQLCWRDFHHQWLAAAPRVAREDYRARRARLAGRPRWRSTLGRAGARVSRSSTRGCGSSLHEGWMHNRARLIAGSFLTKHLLIDWREGAAHFYAHLVDGDVANNTGNWQWVAGTGTDTRPYRMLNPERQAQRFDPGDVYARRWVEELGTPDYPEPIIGHEEAVARFRGAIAT